GARLRPGAPLRRTGRGAAAGLRPAAALRDQRGRGAPRREVLPHGERRVPAVAPAVPLAPPGRAGARHGERVRPAGAGLRRGVRAAEGMSWRVSELVSW